MIKNCPEMVHLTESPHNSGLNVASQGLAEERGRPGSLLSDSGTLISVAAPVCAGLGGHHLAHHKRGLVSQRSFCSWLHQASRASFSRRSCGGKWCSDLPSSLRFSWCWETLDKTTIWLKKLSLLKFNKKSLLKGKPEQLAKETLSLRDSFSPINCHHEEAFVQNMLPRAMHCSK